MEKIYEKGRRKEYKIVSDLRKEGFNIVQRTAGSHSPIDIFAISESKKKIKFVQSKRIIEELMSVIPEKLKEEIEKEFGWLNGEYNVEFEVR